MMQLRHTRGDAGRRAADGGGEAAARWSCCSHIRKLAEDELAGVDDDDVSSLVISPSTASHVPRPLFT